MNIWLVFHIFWNLGNESLEDFSDIPARPRHTTRVRVAVSHPNMTLAEVLFNAGIRYESDVRIDLLAMARDRILQ